MYPVYKIEIILNALKIHAQRSRDVYLGLAEDNHLVIYSKNEKGERIRTMLFPDEYSETNPFLENFYKDLKKAPPKVTLMDRVSLFFKS